MRNSLKGFLCSMAAVCLTILAAVSCTHVDDTLGQDFIPGGNDKLSLHIDTLGLGEGEAITASQVFYDSIGLAGSTRHTRGAMNLHIAYMGRSSDPTFGKITAASIATCLPSEQVRPYFYRGRHSTFDSVKLSLNMKLVSGDPSVRQRFNVYRLRDTLAYTTDTIYYQSFRYEDHIESEPAFSFEYSGTPADIEEIKLDVLPAGEAFLKEMMAADTTLFYSDRYYEYLRQFKGFAIVPDTSTPENAALYVNYLPNTYLNLYYQRDRDDWEIKVDDENKEREITAYMQLAFTDNDTRDNTSIASIRRDYSGTPYAALNEGQRIEAEGVAYVQGIGGMATVLTFPDSFFESLEARKPSSDYTIYINQAQLFVWVPEHTATAYDRAFQMLGSYSNYGKMSIIADYYISDSETTSVEVPYDGKLNRNPGKGYYRMDISSFLQHALLNDDDESRSLTLGGTYTPYEPFSDYFTSLMVAGSERPVQVRVVYTLIKPNGEQ